MANGVNMPPGGRGCGRRKAGGLYGGVGLSTSGVHLSAYMLDPPVPYLGGGAFQGMHEAPEYISAGWDLSKHLILMDWVGEKPYPSVADYVEEGRRYGFSRRIPKSFDWTIIRGRQVWLAEIHAKAAPVMAGVEHYKRWAYNWCKRPGDAEHFPECLYHCWPLAYRAHDQDPREKQRVETPWGGYNPLHMMDIGDLPEGWVAKEQLPPLLPGEAYPHPAFFAVLPLTHLEAVEYVEEDVAAKIKDAGIDLYVTEE